MRLAADSSILVRLYLDEAGAHAIERFLADDANVISVSELARVEVLNVLLRDPDLGAAARFEEDLDKGFGCGRSPWIGPRPFSRPKAWRSAFRARSARAVTTSCWWRRRW